MSENTLHFKEYEYTMPLPSVEKIRQSIVYKLIFILGVDPKDATSENWLNAAMFAVRDLMTESFLQTRRAHENGQKRMVYYLSMEFLMGRAFTNALVNQNLYNQFKQAFNELGLDLESIAEHEADPGLGNGGLGRLAACFLDSLATLRIPAVGYGIRYQYGMFKQEIVDGQQIEKPDLWLEDDMEWEFHRPNKRFAVNFGGHIYQDGERTVWQPNDEIEAIAYDEIIPGYGAQVANPLRLWTAHTANLFNLDCFNSGNYIDAINEKMNDENIARVLYPNDSTEAGRELRLKQEYFLVSASVQDIVARHLCRANDIRTLADTVAIHLNDTHPVLAIPELMRILIDVHQLNFDEAWDICQRVFSYTNHTLMSEALETWSVGLMAHLLPRHLDIIYKINAKFLAFVREQGFDEEFVKRVSIIQEGNDRRVRMAWLAVVTSHKVNGVAKIHSDLMKTSIFADFAQLYPDRFLNVTNGVTPRRWIEIANPPLANLLDNYLGESDWRLHLDKLTKLNDLADDANVQAAFAQVKRQAKERLADYVARELNIHINPDALFDVQIKRIHAYKRQSMNVLHIVNRYLHILANPNANWQPRVFILAGKAASAYVEAKQTIHLINDIAKTINSDERIRDLIKVVFIPNYGVSLAQIIIPAADLSEQISLAGTEASGTSNMKFALNGALTIGTFDGANVEIHERVGDEHSFIFGHSVEQVQALRHNGYNPYDFIDNDMDLRNTVQAIAQGMFSPEDPNRYNSLMHNGDFYQRYADFRSYANAQTRVDEHYRNQAAWRKSAIVNIANMGYFSSDRSIAEYCEKIWQIKPLTEEELPNNGR